MPVITSQDASDPENYSNLDVTLLSEILRVFIPYRVLKAYQDDKIENLLADELHHRSWYCDAWVIANAYRLLQGHQDIASAERELLELLFAETQDENIQREREQPL